MKKIFKKIYNVYLKKLDSNSWSQAHLEQLVFRNYKPQKKLNKIAFLIPNHLDLHHYEDIFSKLNPEEFDIITVSSFNKLDEVVVEYALKNNYTILSINDVFNKKIQYKLAVSINPDFACSVIKNNKLIYGLELLAEKTLRVMFVLGAANWMFNETQNKIFDYIICAGDYHKQQFEKLDIKAKVLALGSPRFDNDSLKVQEAGRNKTFEKFGLNINKKTALWLPTHTEVNSIIDFADMVAQLGDDFNIILKPHPQLLREIESFDDFIHSKIPECKILNKINNMELFPIADFVFCDYGGSVFSAINSDKNVLLFNTKRVDVLETIFGLNSPEVEIRQDIISFEKEQTQEFLKAIQDKTIWKNQAEVRQKIKNRFFVQLNGKSAENIANTLRQILRDEI